MKVILADIYMYAKINEIVVDPIQKDTTYFTLKLTKRLDERNQVVVFKDLMNFTSPMSMDQYLQTWNGFKSKLIWPYTKFSSIEEIMSEKDFPPIEDFFNDLKQVKFYTLIFHPLYFFTLKNFLPLKISHP